tara:strand:+ start:313 stop:654 length:342 start_codon:yes stop_codon:yes gene_type:complete
MEAATVVIHSSSLLPQPQAVKGQQSKDSQRTVKGQSKDLQLSSANALQINMHMQGYAATTQKAMGDNGACTRPHMHATAHSDAKPKKNVMSQHVSQQCNAMQFYNATQKGNSK